jgi:hypothetical protein
MLSLEGNRQIRRRRRGQHSRTTDDQACLDALAAFLRSDAAGAGRSLSRVSREALAVRLLPAARALAQAADLVLTERAPTGVSVELDYALSPACLLGMCTGSAAANPCTGNPCASAACQHACHGRSRPQEARPQEARPQAARPQEDQGALPPILMPETYSTGIAGHGVPADYPAYAD